MSIRDAAPDDLSVIAELIRGLAEYEDMATDVVFDEPQLGRWLFGDDPAARVLLALDQGGSVVGMALYYATFSTFLGRPGIWLEDLYVRPTERGQGHGLALLAALRERTDGRVEWSVLDWNRPAIKFYERQGARPVPGWTTYRWAPGS